MPVREIVLDTETTGLSPAAGHRMVEIGCVELEGRVPTGGNFHRLINPERDVPAEVVHIHGLTTEDLASQRTFAEIAEELLAFLGDADLVIHNAEFDLAFLNSELSRVGLDEISQKRVIDTLLLARNKFPGQSNSLDGLCKRFGIDRSKRKTHGALIDAELLAEVYIDLTDSRLRSLELEFDSDADEISAAAVPVRPEPLEPLSTEEEREKHRAFVKTLGQKAIWNEYLDPES